MAGGFRRRPAWDQNIARCRLAQEAGYRGGAVDTMGRGSPGASGRAIREYAGHVGGGTPGSLCNAYSSSADSFVGPQGRTIHRPPPAYAGGRPAPSRHSPERRVTTTESLSSEAKSRHATAGVRRVHTRTVNSPRPHSTRGRPSRFRPSSRHTGRSRPGSTHAARSGSSSWRSGTRSASGTRSCQPCRGPAR